MLLLFLLGAVVSVAAIGGNIWLARRFAPEAPEESSRQRVLQDRANVTVVREDGEWLIDAITFPTS